MTNSMSKEEMAARIAELEEKTERLEASKGQSVKAKVFELLQSGMNTIEDLAEELNTTGKNISTNLTHIRSDLKENGQTIVSQRFDNKTHLAVVNLIDLNW